MSDPIKYLPCNRCALDWPADGTLGKMHGDPENRYYCPWCYPVQEWEEGRKAADVEIVTSLLEELIPINAPISNCANLNPPDSTAVCDGLVYRVSENQFQITTGRGEGPFIITITKQESEENT